MAEYLPASIRDMQVSDAARLATPEQFQAIIGWFTALLAVRIKRFPVLRAKQPEPELSLADALCLLLQSADIDAMGRSMTLPQFLTVTTAMEALGSSWDESHPFPLERRSDKSTRTVPAPPQRPAKPKEAADDGKCSHPRVACSPTKAKGKLLCRLCETEIDPDQRGD